MKSAPAAEALGLRFDDTSAVTRTALAFALGALWMLGRRYAGFAHDATLYAAMGMHILRPGLLGADLFFAHGSQEAYTLFPRLYAPLIHLLGPGGAALAVTTLGQIGFLAAAALLVSWLTAGPARWWSLALLAALSGYYGGAGVFRMAEPFASARSLAEPLVLAALGAALAGRGRLAWGALAFAALLHPLVAAPAISALVLCGVIRRRGAGVALVALLALTVALAATVPAFTAHFDAPWRGAVEERSPHLFLASWPLDDWARLAWGYCVLGLALPHLLAGPRRLTLAVGATAAAGVVATGIAVDLLDSAFAAGVQAWRAHWLMQFLAIVLLPVAASGLWRLGSAGRAAATWLAASACFGREQLPAAALLSCGAVALGLCARYRPAWVTESTARLMQVLAACGAAAGLLLDAQSRLPPHYGALHATTWKEYLHAAGTAGWLLPLALMLWLAAHSRFRVLALPLSLAVAVAAAGAWDARTAWARFLEDPGPGAAMLRDSIAPGAQVFWPAPQAPAWLVLGRPSWISADQGAGIVFNRETALEYARRQRAADALVAADADCSMQGVDPCKIGPSLPTQLCEDRGGPDYLVLLSRIEGRKSLDWPLPREVLRGPRALHLYSCADLSQK
ncbi:MAG TPA: hypothetical protein VMI15_08790 [Burkholderiales bacterium]|nr:hypothetical protein [Burkholderiales bacterium]